jgi:hypothetical protein
MAYRKIRKKKRTIESGEACEEEISSRDKSEFVTGGMIEDEGLKFDRIA